MLASIVDVSHIGYPLLFLLVMAESGGRSGPGRDRADHRFGACESRQAEHRAGDRAGRRRRDRRRQHRLSDRPQGRALAAGAAGALSAPAPARCCASGEPFFERHGPKAVFFGRFVLGLRVWASWLAGATRMHWRSFVLWNALGGICWATRDRPDRLLPRPLGQQRDPGLRPVRALRRLPCSAVGRRVPCAHRRRRRDTRPRGRGSRAGEPPSRPGDPQPPAAVRICADGARQQAVTGRDALPHVGQHAQLVLGEAREERARGRPRGA